ncbi:MAG: 2-amino-4-hydroxy-6-hydroxymethyldihydropteridine diphosphokinase [Gammaproteobacteria bacterium]
MSALSLNEAALIESSTESVKVYLSAGSNVEPEKYLRMACQELSADFGDLELSSVYRNPAVGFEGDDFLNMVIGFETEHEPEKVVEKLDHLHVSAGRVREGNPFCSRTLDLDVLLYGQLVSKKREFRVPREDIEKYGFVLGPLAEVAPELRHPVNGRTMDSIWGEFDREQHPLVKIDVELN